MEVKSKFTCQNILKFALWVYLLLALTFVGHGLYKTIIKMKAEHILAKETHLLPDKIEYPSITFCYKYKHGGKDALGTYYKNFFEKWKRSGKCTCYVYFTLDIFYTHLLGLL